MIIGVLGSVGIQILSRLFERIRAQEAQLFAARLQGMHNEIQAGNSDPISTIPPNTDYFNIQILAMM